MFTDAIHVDRLHAILSHPDFLEMKGLANEPPIFIQTYAVQKEDETCRRVEQLVVRLRQSGIDLAHVDLFDLSLAVLNTGNRLDRILEREPALGKQRLLDTLKNATDPREFIIPRLLQQINRDGLQLSLLTGVGRAFPFLRAHLVLEALQPRMPRHPVVLFFPGQYDTDDAGTGSQLRPFGLPNLSRAYYRAFNLDHYHL
jgi:hypothetical protein